MAERGVAAVLSAQGDLIAYGAGSVVIIRSLSDPTQCLAYCEHAARVKVAKISPTGKYVASGDVHGKVRVWALTQAEHSLKYELPSIGGACAAASAPAVAAAAARPSECGLAMLGLAHAISCFYCRLFA